MTSETPARKHKKARDTPTDTGITHDDVDKPRKAKKAKLDKAVVTADATNDPEPTSVVVKEKKHKKRKHTENAAATENEDGSVAMEPKKKKKRKHEEAEETVDEGKSRKKKSKKAAEDAEDEADAGGSARRSKKARRKEAEVEDDAAPSASSEASPKKSKNDKRTKEGAEGEDASTSEPAPPSARPEKKKKKRKQRSESGFPDPSEDETLNEQAQKALQYAFSQFDDPRSWKFNKARQNWLVRNVWAEESIPETYMPLVTRYLQGVQGGVRETLIKTCREAIDAPSGEPAPASGETEDAHQAADAEDASPAKRTVKFAVEVESSPAQPSNETKRQRATALLDALTSHT